MNSIRFTLAALAFGATGLTFAAPAFEGGTAANGLTFEPVVSGPARARADVAAEGRAALLAINSRSGHQNGADQNARVAFNGTRSRADVRAEAIAAAQARQPVFEGGEATLVRVERTDRVLPTATLAQLN